jgi:DNA-binding NtrC family response regulator
MAKGAIMSEKNAFILKELSGDQNKHFIGDHFNIGSDELNNLRLVSDDVSPRHARLEKKENHYLIRDLKSQEGTYVNGACILEAILREGDLIKIGSQQFQFTSDIQDKCIISCLKSRNLEWNKHLELIPNIAKTNYPVLLLGPSGTGKDVLTKKIQEYSYQKNGPFISVNCSALTETLIESELFGHVKGSFTGAITDRKGAFEAARGGTLFLDEIGDLPLGLQAKLLRALENNEIRPVGSDKTIQTEVRIITATHQNLQKKVQKGEFRSDLYFRLNVVNISAPALKDRMEDFEDLLFYFAKQMRVRFSFEAIESMKKHSWPGNIRELKNTVARASALFPGENIENPHLDKILERIDVKPPADYIFPQGIPVETQSVINAFTPDEDSQFQNLPMMKEIEKQMIIQRLSINLGNQRKTATELGIPKSTLHDRLKTYNINPKSYSK